MNKPFAAYNGPDSFVFVCYAHKDSESVYADLTELNSNGINLWYDEGIPAGSSWRAEIAAAIRGASKLLFFVSEASLQSNHCLREVDYALNHDLEIIPVYLDDSSLPAELELALNRVQALFRKSDVRYMKHLNDALQNDSGLRLLRPLVRKRNLNFALPVLVMGLVILIGVIWLQTGSRPDSEGMISGAAALPSAFDRYLEGAELMQRWDKEDNLETAVSLFQEATALDPNFALSYARLAEAQRIQYALSGDEALLDEAVSSVEEAVRLNAGLAPVQVVLGRIYAVQGNLDLAFAALERALALDPNDATANAVIGRLYERFGRLEDAEASFQKSVALEPDSLLNKDSFANFLYRQSRFEDAAEQWKDVVRVAPDHFAALTNLGSSLVQGGRTAEAIVMYEQAIAIRPTYMAWSNLGTTYVDSERYDDAVDAFSMAIEINDTDWLAWGNLAYTYSWMSGMAAQAIETFEHAVQLAEEARAQNPRDPFIHSDLALYYAKTGRDELAMQRIATAIILSPATGAIQGAAAEVFELIGQRDRAVEFAQKAFDLGYPVREFYQSPDLAELLNDQRLIDQF